MAESPKAKQYDARVILLGEAHSGKSSLFHRIKYKRFKQSNSRGSEGSAATYSAAPMSQARGYETCTRNILVTPSIAYNFTVLDSIYSQERGQSLSAHFYRRVQVVLLVCSFDNEHSLMRLAFWYDEAKLYLREQRTVFAVVVTKSDLSDIDREVTREMLQAFGSHHELPIYEVSAKTGANINNMLKDIAQRLMDQTRSGGTGGRSMNREHVPLISSGSQVSIDSPFYTTSSIKQDTDCCCSCTIL